MEKLWQSLVISAFQMFSTKESFQNILKYARKNRQSFNPWIWRYSISWFLGIRLKKTKQNLVLLGSEAKSYRHCLCNTSTFLPIYTGLLTQKPTIALFARWGSNVINAIIAPQFCHSYGTVSSMTFIAFNLPMFQLCPKKGSTPCGTVFLLSC